MEKEEKINQLKISAVAGIFNNQILPACRVPAFGGAGRNTKYKIIGTCQISKKIIE